MDKRLGTWRKLQKQEWRDYKAKGGKGVFSISSHKIAVRVGKTLSQYAESPILDIGCGCLPKPAYMCNGLDWYGIDPFAGDKKRQFKFKKATAEKLPYPREFFMSCLFATSIDHVIKPDKALQESSRVLQSGGKVFIWYSRRGGPDYKRWLNKTGVRMFNKHHMWAWTDQTMHKFVSKYFVVLKVFKWGVKNRFLIGMKG